MPETTWFDEVTDRTNLLSGEVGTLFLLLIEKGVFTADEADDAKSRVERYRTAEKSKQTRELFNQIFKPKGEPDAD